MHRAVAHAVSRPVVEDVLVQPDRLARLQPEPAACLSGLDISPADGATGPGRSWGVSVRNERSASARLRSQAARSPASAWPSAARSAQSARVCGLVRGDSKRVLRERDRTRRVEFLRGPLAPAHTGERDHAGYSDSCAICTARFVQASRLRTWPASFVSHVANPVQ